MGPAVSTLLHGDHKKKKSANQSNDSTHESDVSTAVFDRKKNSQDDVTHQLPLFNSSKFPYISSNESPSYSDEPSMSSSIIETPLVKEDAAPFKQNVSDIASKIIPKRAWSGYHLFQLTNMKGDPSQPPRIIKTPRFRSTGHKLPSSLNTINTSAPLLVSSASSHSSAPQQTQPLLIIDNTMDTEKGKEPVEMEQLIFMMKNHKVSDDTASFDFNFGLNNNKPLTPIPSPQSATSSTTSFIPSPEFKFSFSATIPNANNPPSGYINPTTIITTNQEEDEEEEEEDEYDDNNRSNVATNSHYHYHKNEYYMGNNYEATGEGEDQQNKSYNSRILERKILPLPKPRWKKVQDGSSSISSSSSFRIPNPPASILFNMLPPSSTATTTAAATNSVITSTAANSNDDTGNIKKMRCSTANTKSISNKQRHKVDNKRKERNWQDNFTTTAEVTEVHNEFFVDSKKMGLHIPSTPANVSSFTKPATFNLQPSESMKERVRAGLKALQASKATPSSTSSSTVTNSGKKPAAQKKKTAKNQVEHNINNKAQKKNVPPSTAVAPTTTSTAKKKTNNKKRSNREDIAPGGFLSSDVTLFENPISDDWICLFCQYDIFMHGLEEAKRKNGYYRRRRERLKRLKDAELRRLGGLSESEDDQHKEHTCM